MACCDFHDRLGSKMHAVGFVSGDCGSMKLETVEQMIPGVVASAPFIVQDAKAASPGAVPVYDPSGNGQHIMGYGKPEYCCFDCPTLKTRLAAR